MREAGDRSESEHDAGSGDEAVEATGVEGLHKEIPGSPSLSSDSDDCSPPPVARATPPCLLTPRMTRHSSAKQLQGRREVAGLIWRSLRLLIDLVL